MKIIFAQGNPGIQYTHTRHNAGFIMIDHLAKAWDISFVAKPKFYAYIAEHTHQGEKVLLVKPTTFYNETGRTAQALIDFYKLTPSTDLLVLHDELALPFGTIRTRMQGSDAGNNGIKSLNSHLGDRYLRVRIGIYHSRRDLINNVEFVLGTFTKEEAEQLTPLYAQVKLFVDQFLDGTFEATKVVI